MKKLFLVLVLSLITFSLSGCNDLSSPKGVIGSAYQALKVNKLKTFKETLIGAALEQYGNPEGMLSLQSAIADKDLISGAETLTHFEKDFWGRTVEENYTVQILSKKTGDNMDAWGPFWVAKILCKSRYYNDNNQPYPPIGHGDCWGSTPSIHCRNHITQVTQCGITDLEI
jgi:hypothetical protein